MAKKLKYLVLILAMSCLCVSAKAQQRNIDSLKSIIKNTTDSVEKENARNSLFQIILQAAFIATNDTVALRLFDYAFILAPAKADEWAYYNAACRASLSGNKAKAFTYLQIAIDKGWHNISHLRKDADLNSLHGEKEWELLIQNLEIKINERKPTIYWGIYFGILLMLFFYNSILLFFLRERMYFYYVLFLFLYGSIELSRTSELSVYMPDFMNWLDYLNPKSKMAVFCTGMLASVYLLFSASVLNLEEKRANLDKWINRLALITLALTAYVYFFRVNGLIMSLAFIVLGFGFPLAVGISQLRKGYKPARFFVVGNLFYLVGISLSVVIMVLHFKRIVFLVFYPDNVGSILFFAMLSLALGDKINLLKKDKIEAQEKALEVLEEKVQERTAEVHKQKHLVEEKQKEIIDSITYAKRLQEAILPPREFVDKHLPGNFILYKPKDLVAGDFYWAEKIGQRFYIAAADSTGHGVPGAMVSVVCSNALNRSVKEFKETETGSILDKTRELVLETFEKSISEVKDGMDISLLCIDRENKKITWSGANNPLWYIEDGELKEIKADKQPIGKSDYPKPFTTKEIAFKEGTTFYLFTDGFADQFGGPAGKKFKYKQFSELLLKNNTRSFKEQYNTLEKAFEDWKENLEQVDDVCVIGVRV